MVVVSSREGVMRVERKEEIFIIWLSIYPEIKTSQESFSLRYIRAKSMLPDSLSLFIRTTDCTGTHMAYVATRIEMRSTQFTSLSLDCHISAPLWWNICVIEWSPPIVVIVGRYWTTPERQEDFYIFLLWHHVGILGKLTFYYASCNASMSWSPNGYDQV